MAPITISVKVENFECTKWMIEKLGGLDLALQSASANGLTELDQHLRTFAAFSDSTTGVSS